MKGDTFDPKALITEAYKIEGITLDECRSVFLDWALSLPDEVRPQDYLVALLARHTPGALDHPMTQVMKDGLQTISAPKRRGGWRSRPRD